MGDLALRCRLCGLQRGLGVREPCGVSGARQGARLRDVGLWCGMALPLLLHRELSAAHPGREGGGRAMGLRSRSSWRHTREDSRCWQLLCFWEALTSCRHGQSLQDMAWEPCCCTKSCELTQEKASGPDPCPGTGGEPRVASVPAARSGESCSWEHQGLLRAQQSSMLL